MTYTQGPWKIQQTRIDDIAFVSDIHAPHQDNPSENGTDPTIATTWHRPCEGQAEANARLIAASPLMHEAITRFLYVLEKSDICDFCIEDENNDHEQSCPVLSLYLALPMATGAEKETT